MASTRCDDDVTQSEEDRGDLPVKSKVALPNYPTVQDLLALRKPYRVQNLAEKPPQTVRTPGILHLREKFIAVFLEESKRAISDDSKYEKFYLKGHLILTVNDSEKIFIEVNTVYPTESGVALAESTWTLEGEKCGNEGGYSDQSVSDIPGEKNSPESDRTLLETGVTDRESENGVASLYQSDNVRNSGSTQSCHELDQKLNTGDLSSILKTESCTSTKSFDSSQHPPDQLNPSKVLTAATSGPVPTNSSSHPILSSSNQEPPELASSLHLAQSSQHPPEVVFPEEHRQDQSQIDPAQSNHPAESNDQAQNHLQSSQENPQQSSQKTPINVPESSSSNINSTTVQDPANDVQELPQNGDHLIPNGQSSRCFLCKEILQDRASLLLHVENHYKVLAEKIKNDSTDLLVQKLKKCGFSFDDQDKPLPGTEDSVQQSHDTVPEVSASTKSPARRATRRTKTTKPNSKANTKEPAMESTNPKDDNFEEDDEPLEFSDDEENDPSFPEDITTTNNSRGPSTRSRAKTLSVKPKSVLQKSTSSSKKGTAAGRKRTKSAQVKQPVPKENIQNPQVVEEAEIQKKDLTSKPPPPKKASLRLPRQIKKYASKKTGLRTTPKMALKIRMKEETKALAVDAVPEAAAPEPEVSVNHDYKCAECDKKFVTKKAYTRHMRRHSMKKCQCDICGKSFSTLDSLCHHQRGLHGNIKPYSCEECGQTFSFHHSYKLHRQKHSGERPYKCEHCSKSYLTSSHLKAHCTAVHSHSKKSKFTCEVCGKSFNYHNSLRTHQMIHTGERPYKCPLCQKGFVSRQALRTHEQSFHVTAKNYKCETCGKFYKSEMLLNVHKRRHTSDVSRFMCDICGRQFMFKSNLEAHKYVHQEGRPFGCDQCGKAFKCMSSLYTHQYTHKQETPFSCKICNKSFKTRNCCKAHERRHGAEKSFVCPTCNSCFPDKGGLSKHIRTIHNPHKHFVCKLCNKIGTRADNMRTHVKSHGKETAMENVENFIIEVLNPNGISLTDRISKDSADPKTRFITDACPNDSQLQQQPIHDPQIPPVNYSQLDLYSPQGGATIPSHLPPNQIITVNHTEAQQLLQTHQQHYSQNTHQMVNLINQSSTTQSLPPSNQSHVSHTHSHVLTPPLVQSSNNSMTPPLSHSSDMSASINHPVTTPPPMSQSLSPSSAIMQMNPSYTTLHPMTTDPIVLGGMGGTLQTLYAPYKHQ